MPTISSNSLGVYFLSGGTTSALEVVESASAPTANNTALADDQIYIGVSSADGSFFGIYDNGTGVSGFAEITDNTTEFPLLAAATSTTLETSNSITETAARNGAGASTNYVAAGALAWSMSIDGLLDLSTAGAGSSVNIMDAAREQYYVLVKFDTGTDTEYLGQAVIDSISITGGVDDIATYSASFTGFGKLYKN